MTDAAPAGPPDAAAVRAAVAAGQERLRALLPGLTDPAVREPSALPGWSRAHVLSHIEGIGLAMARQARAALHGELVEPYDGGFPARTAAIEEGARRGAAELRAAVGAALDEASAAWAAVGPGDWSRPVRYRDGDLRGALLCWWRELAVHTADARLGPGPAQWPRELCHHLLEYLAPRAPEGVRLVLVPVDQGTAHAEGTARPVREYGPAGAPVVTVRGPLTALTAWLAGREPDAPPAADRAGAAGPLPELRPWP
ncbi:maleylpyruvate isomerase family mycothiol-dependent enzyme [Streptomyces sp. RS10V-4]|uniref:maleylpyruvate isomerase family mycothiol-dependent enzyme n=1 Tax=Streptomyces rhizoryzae TaxID=2932493 RepID=UPI0020047074|nr:maleylpyruvate isomerase family mycothiol-dependent enzyme [Streptomyces rhizoryzae]MCK7624855.1 maleylpyruvate isomerase family mycothiol-dependent enzyme [Streptomyces rhizoryzae]